MDEMDQLAVKTACGVLLSYLESPGSEETLNVEAAMQILENCRHLVRAAKQSAAMERETEFLEVN